MRAAPAPWRTTGTSSGSSTPPSAPSPSGGFSGSIQPTRLATPPKGEGPSPSTVGGLRRTRSGGLVNRDTGAIGHPDRITSHEGSHLRPHQPRPGRDVHQGREPARPLPSARRRSSEERKY